MVATPMPLSAPSVVPSARTQSPSVYILMPWVSKSNTVSAFFWHTMSRWLCRTMCRLFSIPAVAGLRISTLPTSSVRVSKPQSFPSPMTHSRTCSSFFEGRGMLFNALKKCHKGRGSRLTMLMVFSSKIASNFRLLRLIPCDRLSGAWEIQFGFEHSRFIALHFCG